VFLGGSFFRFKTESFETKKRKKKDPKFRIHLVLALEKNILLKKTKNYDE